MKQLTYIAVVAACQLALSEKRLQAQHQVPEGWSESRFAVGGEFSEFDDNFASKQWGTGQPVLVNVWGAAMEPEHFAFMKRENNKAGIADPLHRYALDAHWSQLFADSLDCSKTAKLAQLHDLWMKATDSMARAKHRKAFVDKLNATA